MSPARAARPCSYPGCTNLVMDGHRCAQHLNSYASQGWKRLYQTVEWKQIRERQLLASPWCEDCKAHGVMRVATDVDHVNPHRGDKMAFMLGPFRSLCHSCHSRKTASEVW